MRRLIFPVYHRATLKETAEIFYQHCYHKNPKHSDLWKICSHHPKLWKKWLYRRVMCPNNADGIANNVDPDLGWHCLSRHICPKALILIDMVQLLLWRIILWSVIWQTIFSAYNRATLKEAAGIMKDLGAINAVNLDGGGSATVVVNNTLISYPSDFWWV